MKKIIWVIVLAILTGIGFSLFIFKKYEAHAVSKEINKIYFFQQGVYSNYNNMVKNTEKLEGYTYEKKDSKYYVYVCFTMDKENISKIEEYFKSLNYSVIVKEKDLSNYKFINILEQYDYLLEKVKRPETIKNICKQLVVKYDEYK